MSFHDLSYPLYLLCYLIERPTISFLTSPISISAGSSVYLRCVTTGYPMPAVTWYRDGAAVNIVRIFLYDYGAK